MCKIRGPEPALVEFGPTHGAQVSDQSVKPHVEHMRRFARHWNSPSNRGARNREIPQPTLHKTQNFVSPALRTDEIRIRGIEIEQLLLEFDEFEKVVFFCDCFCRASAIGTRIAGACVNYISVVVHAILAGVMPFLDVP